MKKKMGIIAMYLSLFGCQDSINKAEKKDDNNKDTFQQDIPHRKNKLSTLYTISMENRDFLGGMDTLENGYDSLQIRLWYESDSSRKIVVIKKNRQWVAECYTYHINTENPDSIYVDKLEMIRSLPKMSWPKLMDSLINLNVLTLPDQENVPGLAIYYNNSTVNVEVATRTKYRFYSYAAPVKLAKNFEEARSLIQIMKLIRDEFGFDTDILKNE